MPGAKRKTDNESMAPAILRLCLGECLTAPTRRMVADLHEVALAYRDGQNHAARAWQRWREDHPDWTPQQATVRGKPKVDAEGNPVLENPIHPQSETIDGKPCCFQTFLAASARSEMFRLAGVIASQAAGDVLDDLRSKMPYNHEGRAEFRWQAILEHEVNLSTYRSLEIPYLNNMGILCYQGRIKDKEKCKGVSSQLWLMAQKYGKDSAVIGFPLFSKAAGRKYPFHICKINVGALPEGLKDALKRLASGEWKISDSRFVFKPAGHNSKKRRDKKERGTWYLHLFYRRPAEGPACNPKNIATLALQKPDCTDPFLVAHGEASWRIGQGQLFQRMLARLDSRRRNMRTDYKVAGHGRKGHGQQRNQRDVRKITRHVLNLCNDIVKKSVSDVVKFCQLHDCGTLHWSMPSLNYRPHSWFARHDLQWDWTLFDSTLQNACKKARIKVIDPIREERRRQRAAAQA